MEDQPYEPAGLGGIPDNADDPVLTPVDYIVVGSGAGGGPLAARLARNGMRVLVLEAGGDPGILPEEDGVPVTDSQRQEENRRLIHYCPGLHAASTEPALYGPGAEDTSWGFRVQHFRDNAWQGGDSKAFLDESTGKNAVLYPRATALGGCTAHHAMISMYGADYDWQKIADLTGDNSWAPGKMRAIYERMERRSLGIAQGWLRKAWEWFLRTLLRKHDATAKADEGSLSKAWKWFLRTFKPGIDSSGQLGDFGWLDIQDSDPKLAMGDSALFRKIVTTVLNVEGLSGGIGAWRTLKWFFSGRFFKDLDLNDIDTLRTSPEGVALVPLSVSRGVRRGPREHLLETRQLLEKESAKRKTDDSFAGELRIALNVFVRRVLFADVADGKVPRAVGVEISTGHRLYDPARSATSARPPDPASQPAPRRVYARREILLCGGTFNTPQLLMLSGIGDRAHLAAHTIQGMAGEDGKILPGLIIDLPGVGGNLRDRCEISVISEMKDDFETLTKSNAYFDPNATDDRALAAWKAEGKARPRSGLYTTNGAALAILKRAPAAPDKPKNLPPDLLILAFPAAFRGYYPGWSKELLRHPLRPPGEICCKLWSWTILRAYSVNCGSVRLRSNNPFEPPDIQFDYFGGCAADCNEFNGDMENDDLAALRFGVKYVRGLNRQASSLMKDGNALKAEIQPGQDKADGSRELGDWLMKETWGHHAAGTCRIGFDPWRANPQDLKDKNAVLDSSFRVHGVRGLRVVDASVFPTIPGYFIATPTCMIGEKAADTILDELSR